MLLLLAACRDQEQADVENPEILSVQLDGIVSESYQIIAGNTYQLNIHVTDNRKVAAVQILLTPDEQAANPCVIGTTLSEHISVNRDDAELNFTLVTDSAEEGPHSLTIIAEDEVGLTTQKLLHVIVNNPDNPSITGSTSPAFDVNDVITMNAGENLIVNGEANDDSGLSQLQVMLLELDGTLVSSTNISITNTPMSFSGASFDNAVPGSYRVVIQATDTEGNMALWGKFVNVQ
jgi:hypothetical protein